MKNRTWGLLILIGLLSLSCQPLQRYAQSQFYQPDHRDYGTPAQHGLAYEPVAFQSADGTRLTGWFVPAKGVTHPRQARGTVIHVHGNAQNMGAHFGFVDWLPAQGFNVFAFDYRGYGQSEGTPTAKGIVEDTQAAFEALHARNDIDPHKLFVFAQSLGAATAITALGTGPQRAYFRAAALEAGFSAYGRIASEKIPGAGWLMDDHFSADNYIAELHMPCLIIHGTADAIVPFHHGEILFQKAREPKQFMPVEGGSHLSTFVASDDARQRLISFFESTLRPSSL